MKKVKKKKRKKRKEKKKISWPGYPRQRLNSLRNYKTLVLQIHTNLNSIKVFTGSFLFIF